MRRRLVLLFKIGFISAWVIMFFFVALWTSLEPIGNLSAVFSVFRYSVSAVARYTSYEPLKEFSRNADLSNDYERAIQRLKTDGFVPRDMSIDMWIVSSDSAGSASSGYALNTSRDKCIILVDVSPGGRAWSLNIDDKSKTFYEEPIGDMLTQEVMHEVAHCVLNSHTAFDKHGDDIAGRDKSGNEKFADIYGLAMTSFINQDLNETFKIGKRIFIEREVTATNVRYSSEPPAIDTYDTSHALAKMVGWMREIKAIPDAKSSFERAIEFSGVTSFHPSSSRQHADFSL